jgi:thioredoxin-related protein
MQKLLIITLLLVAGGQLKAQSDKTDKVVWLDWNAGYEKATKEGKIVLVDAFTTWCGWCKKMDADTYANPQVVKYINEHFVAVKFNPEVAFAGYKVGDQTIDNQQLYSLLCQGKSTGFPTTYFITISKNTLNVDVGYKGAADFMKVLNEVVNAAGK